MKNHIKALVLGLVVALALPYAAHATAAQKSGTLHHQKQAVGGKTTTKSASKLTVRPASKSTAKAKPKSTKATRKVVQETRVHKVVSRRSAATRTLYQDVKAAKYIPAQVVEPEFDAMGNPLLKSAAFMVQDLDSGKVLLERNAEAVVPIASITKLMTAMVALDVKPSLSEELTITEDDTDKLKNTGSRLVVGTALSREMMMHLALMSSENRAAAALARNYPGGVPAFVYAMNQKAHALGLVDTAFHDPTGLNPNNVSSARDLAKMVTAASKYPLIREFSTDSEQTIMVRNREQTFRNTNALVKNSEWQIGVSKTGFINEAGRCLVMQAWLANKPIVIVLLDSVGKFTRVADAQRVKRWVEAALVQHVAHLPAG